jgi:hypothetical protein
MKEPLKTFSGTVHWCQILIGTAGLLIGTLVYLVDRPPDQIYFIYKSSIDISLYNTLPNIFGTIGNSLPAFIHVFSFILITAGMIPCQKRGYLIICISWFIVDIAFELGQKYQPLTIEIIPDWFERILFLENTRNYFLRGTFDFTDLAVTAFGTVIAYLVLLATMERREMS